MWYFAWILGLSLAAAFAILNAMWLELMEDEDERLAQARLAPLDRESAAPRPKSPGH